MKLITIDLWVDDDMEVNDINVGRELGEALMTGTLTYTHGEDTESLKGPHNYDGSSE